MQQQKKPKFDFRIQLNWLLLYEWLDLLYEFTVKYALEIRKPNEWKSTDLRLHIDIAKGNKHK